jgi:hypothetical protein
MAHLLLAVLVPHATTADTIAEHLAAPLSPLLAGHTIDDYRLGGGCTGAWDPGYDVTLDPRNWRPCTTCDGTTQVGGGRCLDCLPAFTSGLAAGKVLEWNAAQWAPHPGDIVPLPRLLDTAWRYPKEYTPDAWVDQAGTVWLDTTDTKLSGTDTGATPPRLWQVFDDLHTGRRNPEPAASRARFDPARWAVAVVDAHH